MWAEPLLLAISDSLTVLEFYEQEEIPEVKITSFCVVFFTFSSYMNV